MNRILNFRFFLLCCGFILLASNLKAQTPADTTTYRLETTDGNTFIGKIIEQDALKLIFKSDKLGDITIDKSDILKMEPIDTKRLINGKYWFDNPQATRYFFSPNGYGLKAGEGYYQNVWVLVNSFAVGITDNISVGGGIVPLFLFAGTPTPVWVTPKFSLPIKKDKFNLGAGALLGGVIGESETGFGILYGITTFGSKDNNLSIGLGYGYAGGQWAKSPMINVNMMFRTGARGYFISENYYIQTVDGNIVLLSLGGRSIIKSAGLDYGLVIPLTSNFESLFALPWLGLTIPFGNKKEAKPKI